MTPADVIRAGLNDGRNQWLRYGGKKPPTWLVEACCKPLKDTTTEARVIRAYRWAFGEAWQQAWLGSRLNP